MFTVITGVLVFVISQLLMHFVIEPASNLKKEIGSITNTFIRRSTGEESFSMIPDTVLALRQHAAALMEGLSLVPFYGQTRKVIGLPTAHKIVEAAHDLNMIANQIDYLIEKAESDGDEEVNWIASDEIVDACNRLGQNLGIAVFLGWVTRLLDERNGECLKHRPAQRQA